MLHKELLTIAEPTLGKVLDHPFWAGLRDGSLPGEALLHFVRQDSGHLLPAYGRALARCGASAYRDSHALLLGRSVVGSLEAGTRLRSRYEELAAELELPSLDGEQAPVDPSTHAYTTTLAAASASSFAAGIGALLPMVWFNHKVCEDLVERHTLGSRYDKWIEAYQPGPGYARTVQAFLDMVDEVGQECSEADRARLVEQFTVATRYEWVFAEACWQRPGWPV